MENLNNDIDINIPPKSVMFYILTILCLLYLHLYVLAVIYMILGFSMISYDDEGEADYETFMEDAEFWESRDDYIAELFGFDITHRDLEDYLDIVNLDIFVNDNDVDNDIILKYYQKMNYYLNINKFKSNECKQLLFNYSGLNVENSLNFSDLYFKYSYFNNIIINYNINNINYDNIKDIYLNYNLNINNSKFIELYNEKVDMNKDVFNNKILNSINIYNITDLLLDNLSIFSKKSNNNIKLKRKIRSKK